MYKETVTCPQEPGTQNPFLALALLLGTVSEFPSSVLPENTRCCQSESAYSLEDCAYVFSFRVGSDCNSSHLTSELGGRNGAYSMLPCSSFEISANVYLWSVEQDKQIQQPNRKTDLTCVLVNTSGRLCRHFFRGCLWGEKLRARVRMTTATHSSILAWRIPYGPRSLVGSSPRGRKESDTTEQLTLRYEGRVEGRAAGIIWDGRNPPGPLSVSRGAPS